MICPNCALAADSGRFDLHVLCRDFKRTGCDCSHRPIIEFTERVNNGRVPTYQNEGDES